MVTLPSFPSSTIPQITDLWSFLPQPSFMKHKKGQRVTWAEHCSKWQANALVISKKRLTAKTYIFQFWSCLQTIFAFTIHYVFRCLIFFHFLLHAIWEVSVTKVPEQIACILACIAVWYLHPIYTLELRREGSTIHFLFMCFIYISKMENKKKPHTNLQSTQDMHMK